jgi:sterol desaturase/sphingolipid hydroxylase (fatty acid hydroxylase superfamily)
VSLSILRFCAFAMGLGGLRAAEALAPDHEPLAPRPRRWTVNLGLGLVNGVLVSLLCASCYALTASGYLPARFAPLRAAALPAAVTLLLEVLLLDLFTYFLHRAYHAAPLLWRLHRLHHSDVDLDVSSASRFHTGEVVVSSVLKLGFVALLGVSATGLAAFELVMLACAQLQHSNLRLPAGLERALWWSVVPPAMHRIHHWPDACDTDSNVGTIVTAWDRLFGTLNRKPAPAVPRFGLAARAPSDASASVAPPEARPTFGS